MQGPKTQPAKLRHAELGIFRRAIRKSFVDYYNQICLEEFMTIMSKVEDIVLERVQSLGTDQCSNLEHSARCRKRKAQALEQEAERRQELAGQTGSELLERQS